jgi:ubiquinone/menaquinone biosynthesis C-methylase UbiE
MKIEARPKNALEWIALLANLAPIPLVHSQLMPVLSRAVMEASTLDVFEAAKDGPITLEQAVEKTGLNKKALHSLLQVLTSADYFKYKNGTYSLTKMARKWCLKDSENSVYSMQKFNIICWDWMNNMGEYLKTGKGLQFHETLNADEWNAYQLGMADVSKVTAKMASKMTPVPPNPSQMLDIGGAHGLYSIEMCKKYPTLEATILDLPEAVEKAKPILDRYNSGQRVSYWQGDALKEDLGSEKYDIILISSLMHHFTEEQNKSLSSRVAKALKPGGTYIIQEFIRPEEGEKIEMIGAITDLFFNLSSTAGNWSLKELKDFQTGAGLKHFKVNKYITLPGFVQVCGHK